MILPRFIPLALLAFLDLLAFPAPMTARAEMRASPAAEFREATLRLLGERDAQGQFRGALEIRLAEGFKTYWKNAGDSGVPPVFDFSQSRGVSDVNVRLPLPHAFDDGAGGKAFGYMQDVMFVLEGKSDSTGLLHLKLDFAVCGKLCIPLSAALALDITNAPLADAKSVATLATTRAALPKALGTDGVSVTRAGENEFNLSLPYAGDAQALQIFPDAPAFFEVKDIRASTPGMVSVRLLAQPAPGKSQLGPLSLTYGTANESFERIVDIDSLKR